MRRDEGVKNCKPNNGHIIGDAMSMSSDHTLLDRMVQAVERVRQRLLRASAALESAGIPYAVVDDHAVAAWVATVDPSAVRNSPDVHILLRRANLEAASLAMEAAGFIHRHDEAINTFFDGPDATSREQVSILLADAFTPAPDVTDAIRLDQFRVLRLEPLVKMNLISFRHKDNMHVRDMLEVGLIDQSWVSRFPPDLASRLQQLIDTPEG
jgi:hypothetical protein